ncbi:MAG: zf-TFIIB domain-containing protein [Candidatus Eremiobacterota bacterium]
MSFLDRLLGRTEGASMTERDPVCPGCGVALELTALGGAALHVCPACVGLWVTRQTMPSLLDEPDFLLVPFLAPLPAATPGPDSRACPVCQWPMLTRPFEHTFKHGRRSYRLESTVQVDVCRSHGVWLDPGELRLLREWYRSHGYAPEPHPGDERDYREVELAFPGSRVSHGRGEPDGSAWRDRGPSAGWTCFGPYVTLDAGLWQFRWHFELRFRCPDQGGTMLRSDVVTGYGGQLLGPLWSLPWRWFCEHEQDGRFRGYWDRLITLRGRTENVEYRLLSDCPCELTAHRLEIWRP